MSSESRVISTKETSMTSTSETNNAVSYFYSPYVSLAPAVSYTSSLIINLQQLHRDLTDQYQHEKQTLSELNRQFRLFIERVQNLESQNAKYLAQIADFRHQLGMSSNIDEQSSEMYLHHQSDLISANKFRADYEFAYELSQIEVSIYRQLIEAELQGKDQQKSKLEQELKQTSSSLNTLRASYGELEHEVGRLFAEREDINQKYLRMARDWCNVRKLNRESQLTTQTLKSFIRFYQNLRSSSERQFGSFTTGSKENKDFWAVELENAVKKIRRDFEALYGSLHRQMVQYYDTQIDEVRVELENSSQYVNTEYERFVETQQTLKIEYEKTQQTFSYEKEMTVKLEATYAKLESDYKALQVRNDEQVEIQSNEIQARQESLMNIAYAIDELKRSKLNLEAEIIVYRHLLGLYDQTDTPYVVPHPSIDRTEFVGRYLVDTKKKGSIGIKECAPNGAFITLVNNSSSKDIDLARWTVIRKIDSSTEYRYTIPNGVRLQRGEELRIYSKLGYDQVQSSANYRGASPRPRPELVNRELSSWGAGNRVETFLFNEAGEEKASHLQSVAVDQRKL